MFYKKKDMSVNDSRFLYEEEIDNLNVNFIIYFLFYFF